MAKTKQSSETSVSDGVKILVATADLLIKNKLAQWKKLDLVDGTTGIGLFFPDSIWEVTNDGNLALKKKNE